jgi:hypothetical protein
MCWGRIGPVKAIERLADKGKRFVDGDRPFATRPLSGGFYMRWTLIAVVLCGVVGCGSSGTISGQVKYKGELLRGGSVMFTNTEGRGSRTARIMPDGTFKIEDFPTGPAKITVETQSVQMGSTGMPRAVKELSKKEVKDLNVDKSKEDEFRAKIAQMYGGLDKSAKVPLVPAKYNDPEKSGVTYTVTSGQQTKDIDLD